VRLEASNDAGIQRLDEGGKIGIEVDELDVGRLVTDVMPSEIVECVANVTVQTSEVEIKELDVPVD
jgi:hypothetical protein